MPCILSPILPPIFPILSDDIIFSTILRRAAGVMMLPIPRAGTLRAVHGVDDARRVTDIEDVAITAHVGQTLEPLPEGWQYLGFVFARGETPDAIEQALRDAHARLRFTID